MTFRIAKNRLSSVSASEEQIGEVQSQLQQTIPTQLTDLWRVSNGLLNDRGYLIYGTDLILERNTTMEVYEYDQSLLLFGDDSGGYGFFFKTVSENDLKVYSLDLGAIGSLDPKIVAEDFQEWINANFG